MVGKLNNKIMFVIALVAIAVVMLTFQGNNKQQDLEMVGPKPKGGVADFANALTKEIKNSVAEHDLGQPGYASGNGDKHVVLGVYHQPVNSNTLSGLNPVIKSLVEKVVSHPPEFKHHVDVFQEPNSLRNLPVSLANAINAAQKKSYIADKAQQSSDTYVPEELNGIFNKKILAKMNLSLKSENIQLNHKNSMESYSPDIRELILNAGM